MSGEHDAGALLARDKRALGRAISLFEDARPAAAEARAALLAALAAHPGRRRARFAGITGPPGAGKSTLIAELAPRLIAHGDWSVCVLAVNPTSAATGGAILGDRVRVKFPADEPRLFFRSQASDLELGGLGRYTFAVSRLLQYVFDCVLIETVGVGQSEIEVARLADRTYLVLPPQHGDAVQLMKAGVLEIPDAVVLSKQDLPGAADGTAAALAELVGRRGCPLFRVSVRSGLGLDAWAADVASIPAPPGQLPPLAAREPAFLARWVEREFGRRGRAALDAHGGPAAFLAEAGGFERAEATLPAALRRWLAD